MRSKKAVGLVIATIMVLVIALAALPAAAADTAIVYVDTAQELQDAIASDTQIILSGATYVFEDFLLISGVENLAIKSSDGAKIASTSYEDVVVFIIDCHNISICGITIEHDLPPQTGCTDGVIYIQEVRESEFENCSILGCGTEAFNIHFSSVKFRNCLISDCSRNIGLAWSSDVDFENCSFYKNGYANYPEGLSDGDKTSAIRIIDWEDSKLLRFLDCEFRDNNNTYFKTETTLPIPGPVIHYCEDGYNSGYTFVGNCLFSGNSWQTSTETESENEDDSYAGADSWAKDELESAMANSLIMREMIAQWQTPTTRLLAAGSIVNLIEVSTGKSIEEIAEECGFDMSDRFADTQSVAVTFLKAAGISNGMDGVIYDPSGVFTRAQMVTMLGRAAEYVFGIDVSGYPKGSDFFTDVPDWADTYVGWAAVVKITEGVGDGLFASDRTLQNQETCVFAYRSFQKVFSD